MLKKLDGGEKLKDSRKIPDRLRQNSKTFTFSLSLDRSTRDRQSVYVYNLHTKKRVVKLTKKVIVDTLLIEN